MIKSIAVLSSVLCLVLADFCKEEKGIESFDPEKFKGVWYFSYRYGIKTPVSFANSCMKSDLNVTENGFEAKLEFYNNGKRKSFVVDVPLKKEGGSYFQITPKGANVQVYAVLLDTDYENYVTEYFCMFGKMAEGFIRTRSKNPSPEIIEKAKEVAKQRVPDVNTFVDLNCATSDI
ncbi:unnamed protein product [Acanthoscelides obtectus]|uniref:Lipocalin/cytosolic fatty-acid binding domain-containing protein n=1 Tax=Acanthoscelides obtectus TaxID=200917 RepID=A0A9P0KTU1_ACAOB|nr:unnamed protein product [Acanthoscelides obtectus]CAK1620949.1 hypothetical protein AOBTE_LOCUS666 [Acanthoscelides obtectus]